MGEPLDLDAIAAKHHEKRYVHINEDWDETPWQGCAECAEDWPCDTSRVVALARAQAAELAVVRDAVDYVVNRTHLVDQGYAGDGWQSDQLEYQEKILRAFLAGTLQLIRLRPPEDDEDE